MTIGRPSIEIAEETRGAGTIHRLRRDVRFPCAPGFWNIAGDRRHASRTRRIDEISLRFGSEFEKEKMF